MLLVRVIKKFNIFLSHHQKKRSFELVLLMIIGGLLETLSASLVLPLMDIIMNPAEIMREPHTKWLCELLGIETSGAFLMILSLLLAMLFLIKNMYLLLEYNFQYRFVYGNMFVMQQKLVNTIIHKPYEYFLRTKTGDVIRFINTDTLDVFYLLTIVLQFLTEFVVSLMLMVTVFIMSPVITTAMAIILLILVIVINRVIKPILQRAGLEKQHSLSGMNKWLIQSIQGIKEIKVINKETYFEENYKKNGGRFVNSLRKQSVLEVVPKFLIEALCMSTVFIIIGIFVYSDENVETMIPILTVIAVAAMRLLPSVNRMSSALGSISYYEPMLDKLIENLQGLNSEISDNLSMTSDEKVGDVQKKQKLPRLQKKLSFNCISYKYPSSESFVLEKASMEILKGQSVGIVGATGSGKTTSVDILLGLLVPQEGAVLVDGVDIRNDIYGWLCQIGYIPQEIFMLDDTIRANVAFGESDVSDNDVWHALADAALDEFVHTLPDGLDTQIGERGMRLSGGQKQRIGIARALYHNPDVLFFDEATSALDNETEMAIMESVNSLQGKKTMIIIAHRLTTIENCDVVYRVEDGKIVRER